MAKVDRRLRAERRVSEVSDHRCECGCGRLTMVSTKSDSKRGWVKGRPRRFVRGHRPGVTGERGVRGALGPVTLCACGCGVPCLTVRMRRLPGHGRRSGPAYVVSPSGCWLWQWSIASHGYARIRVGGRQVRAHRFYYERVHGPIPAGWDVHHECGVRSCVNPAHLRAMSREEHNALHAEEAGHAAR